MASSLGRTIKNSVVMSAEIVSYMIFLFLRIPLSKVIGDAGVGLFSPAFELFFLTYLFASYSMSRAMTGAVRYRVKREQFKSAKKVFRAGFFLNFTVGAVLALSLFITAGAVAETAVLEPLSKMALMAAAPSIVFAAIIGIFRGYFNGYGLGMAVAHSQYLEAVSMALLSCLCGRLLYGYGGKVSALLQKESYAYGYGALGAMIGVMLAQIVALVHLLILYAVYSGAFRGKIGMDNSKRMETQRSLQGMLLGNSIPLALTAILTNVFMLLDQRMFNYCMNQKEMGDVRTALWGCYYGKAAVVIGICAAIGVLSVQPLIGKIGSAFEREEYRVMRDRLGKAVKRFCIVSFPMAAYLAVIAQSGVKALFPGAEEEWIAGLIQRGAVVVILYGVCFLFAQMMYRTRMLRELLVTTALSFAVHAVSVFLFVRLGSLGAEGVVYSVILFLAVYAVLDFLLVSRNLKYRQEWLGTVGFTAGAACVSALLVMGMMKVTQGLEGGFVLTAAFVILGLFVYITLLMALRVIGEAELSKLPFGLGFLFIMLGRNLRIL